MVRLTLIAGLLLVIGGCKTVDPNFCGLHQDDSRCPIDGPPTGGEKCTMSSQCPSSGFPVCDTSGLEGKCVACTPADAHLCVDATPVCTKNQCAACTKHTDCPESLACLPSGACAKSTDVAYVDGDRNVDSVNCTKVDPCKSIAKALGKKMIVKVFGTVQERPDLNNRMGMILADPNTVLRPMTGDNGTVLAVRGNSSDLQIYDLQISNGTGGNAGIGISLADSAKLSLTRVSVITNSDRGIAVTGMNSSLTCTQCSLLNNGAQGLEATTGNVTITQSKIANNSGGGVHFTASAGFHIIGNFIYQNGQAGLTAASGVNVAVNMQAGGAPANELNFNSITGNFGADLGQGIQCVSGTQLTTSNNIVWSNGVNPVTDMQVFGTKCSFTYSDIGPIPDVGTMNIMDNPQFAAAGDLHLMPTSPAQGGGDPAVNLTGLTENDIDGEPRAKRTGKGPDIGADQYYPPAGQ